MKGKSTTQEKAFKGTSSYKTAQVYPPVHNTTPQPSKVVSPFTSIESKAFDNIAIYTPMSNSFCRDSCETPNRSISGKCGSICPGKVRLPSRKRNISESTTMNKRTRSQYGRVRSTFQDDEMEYSFLSNWIGVIKMVSKVEVATNFSHRWFFFQNAIRIIAFIKYPSAG